MSSSNNPHLHQQQKTTTTTTEAPATGHTFSLNEKYSYHSKQNEFESLALVSHYTARSMDHVTLLVVMASFACCVYTLWEKTWASAHFCVKPTNVLSVKPFILVEADTTWQRKEKRRWSGKGAAMLLFQLPEDVLFLVLSYLDPRSLCRLSQACKRSYQFISRDVVWRKIAKGIINTGLTRQGIDS